MQMEYACDIDGGQGGDGTVEADNLDEAMEAAVRWAREGDWPDEGCEIKVRVWRIDDGEEVEEAEQSIDIEPDHDTLIRQAGGDPDCEHDWTAEGEGGCTENPGVWSHGGNRMTYATHCRLCGLRRVVRDPGSQRNPDEHETVTYEQPADWCIECDSE
jgi:hypothetical protein